MRNIIVIVIYRSGKGSKAISKALGVQRTTVHCRPHLVSVHDSTIRKRWSKNDIHGRVPRQKPLLTKKNTKACLTFAIKHLDDPQDFWENILYADETKVDLLGRCTSG